MPDPLTAYPPSPAWVALSLIRNIGGVTFRALLAHFGHRPEAILQATTTQLCQVRGVGKIVAAQIQAIDLDATARAIDRWQAAGVHILTWHDPTYPRPLKTLHDAPPTLFARGDLNGLAGLRAVGVVGTRQPSALALSLAEHLAGEIIRQQHTVVSGLAYGIDRAAHLSALAGGRTVAVLGSGVLNVYPPEHRALADAIMMHGALVGEVAPDAPVSTPGLVARNRIISGLCAGIIVVETEQDGGAMHAARFARAQGRRVYAVDLPISGNRQLIDTDGATPLPTTFAPLGL